MKVSIIWKKKVCIGINMSGKVYDYKNKFAAEYKGFIGIGSTWIEAIKNCAEEAGLYKSI